MQKGEIICSSISQNVTWKQMLFRETDV